MAGHMPGPWRYEPENGYIIAPDKGGGEWYVASFCGSPDDEGDTKDANGELIARAPDLLIENEKMREMLEEAWSALQQFRGIKRGQGWDDALDQLDEAQTAISEFFKEGEARRG